MAFGLSCGRIDRNEEQCGIPNNHDMVLNSDKDNCVKERIKNIVVIKITIMPNQF